MALPTGGLRNLRLMWDAVDAGAGGTIIAGVADVPGLVADLAGKAASSHAHAPADITGTAVVTGDARLSDARTPVAHTHGNADLTGLAASLAAKADTGHTHTVANVTGLQAAIDGKAATAHTHAPSEITGTAVVTADARLSDARTPVAHDASLVTAGTMATARLGSGTANGSTFLRGDQTWAAPAGGASPVVYVAAGADVAINNAADQTIVTRDVTGVGATDIIDVTADFVILNNSTATRVYVLTLDFDGLFDVEFTTGALATSATLMHPFTVRGVLNIRSTSLAYATFVCEGQLAAGIASGADTTMAATHLRAQGWGTTASNASSTTTVALKIRSADATATQTCRLLSCVINKYTPT